MVHNPVYNPTYTMSYDMPLGVRITDLPYFRVYSAGGGGGEHLERRKPQWSRVWTEDEESFLRDNVIDGTMTLREASIATGHTYDATRGKLKRMGRAGRNMEERRERTAEILRMYGDGQTPAQIAPQVELSVRSIQAIVHGQYWRVPNDA
uniref:Uncharacterized protein n=1 Tax=viral metagenome TaxID=1070528 RepID=A0A6M3LTH9_9ZZZZ